MRLIEASLSSKNVPYLWVYSLKKEEKLNIEAMPLYLLFPAVASGTALYKYGFLGHKFR